MGFYWALEKTSTLEIKHNIQNLTQRVFWIQQNILANYFGVDRTINIGKRVKICKSNKKLRSSGRLKNKKLACA